MEPGTDEIPHGGSRQHSSLRALGIFNAVSAKRRPMTLSEIADATRMPVSTCHGVLKALEADGYLSELSGRAVYPTRKLWELAETIRLNDPVTEQFIPHLQQLREDTNETVILGTRQGDRVQYLSIFESAQAIRYSSQVGAYKPLHSSAIGKAILASLTEKTRADVLKRIKLTKVTSNTLTTRQNLFANLEDGSTRGYQITRGENVADVMAIASPLKLDNLLLGVAIAGPMQRVEQAEKKLAKALLKTIQELIHTYD